FLIVAEHSQKSSPDQLCMYLGGDGGTGKSRVITCWREMFLRHHQECRFRLVSFTGAAAQNIQGMTVHAALCQLSLN
ncbi:hypothetical protein BDQ17DRAFT_1268147, partial [Cyathus striatus]